MAKDNRIIIEIPEAQLDFSNEEWKNLVKKDFQDIQNSLESKPNPGSPAYYTWFWFFMKYGRALCSKEGQAYLQTNNLNPFTFVKDVVGLTMSGGGAYTIGYKFFEECLKNTSDVDVSGIKIQRKEFLNKLYLDFPLQQIFYGAPGTGKSNTIKREVEDKGRIHFRTTFHPDSDYSTFVGCYKPTMKLVKKTVVIGQDEKEVKPLPTGTDCVEQISYQFVPQAFTKAYCEAWNRYDGTEESEPVFLIIEEINRGNCAQIFGDIFQLLDRKGGFSEYPIDADEDLKKFLLNGTKEDGTPWLTNKDGIKDGQLCLPPNLYIWATMNTSDQSLFPIDSAFKRRWDWKYVKIKNESKNWTIEGGRDWWAFLKKINGIIAGMTQSADKQLGYYFCKPSGTEISAETFVNKVCFYLWNDVFKNFGSDEYAELFKIKVDGKDCELTFPDFFGDNGEVDKDVALQFIKNVMKYGESQDEPSESQEEQA